jgi:RsiW-degrading membrane proteinase PrsW (M82 family)
MSTPDAPNGWAAVPTVPCHVCDANAPAGEFCAICGAALSRRRGDGPAWLRLRSYAAAPKEHVLSPRIVSALFPRLPRRSRASFRVGLLVLAVLLVAFALLRWQGPLIGISALGLLLLFGIYLYESDAFTDMSGPTLLIACVLGAGLGVGWSVTTGAVVARTYDDVLGTPMTMSDMVVNVLAIPIGALILMLVPVAVLRLLRPGVRESLDGFAIGVLVALCFTTASTLTRLAPQFEDGLFEVDRPIADFLVTAVIQGVVVPVAAAGVVGALGATLWLKPRTNAGHRRRWFAFTAPFPALVAGVLAYTAMGVVDVAWLPQEIEAGLYALIALLVLLVLRIVLHATLLHEVPDDTRRDTAVLCPQCDHVVPDLPFCPSCGAAAHAASRTSRQARRDTRPVPVDTAPEGR